MTKAPQSSQQDTFRGDTMHADGKVDLTLQTHAGCSNSLSTNLNPKFFNQDGGWVFVVKCLRCENDVA